MDKNEEMQIVDFYCHNCGAVDEWESLVYNYNTEEDECCYRCGSSDVEEIEEESD